MRFWVSAIGGAGLALAGCAQAGSAPRVGKAQAPAKTAVLKVDAGGRSIPVRVAIDPAAVDPANDHVVKSLGIRGSLLLLTDSYASRGQGMSRCQAGHETWVRVIDTRARAERWSKLAESCLHDIVPGDPVAAWAGPGTDFTVNLLSEPGVRGSVGTDGRVVMRR